MATLVIMLSALIIAVGTSAPIITKLFGTQGQVGPSFYNRVNMPLALLTATLLALVPFLSWRGVEGTALLRKLIPGALAGLIATGIAVSQGVQEPFHLLFILLSATALTNNLQKAISMARRGGLAKAGGYLAHVGVGVMFLGFLASSAYDQSAKVTLEQGVPQQVGDLELTFQRFVPRQGREKESMEIRVARDDGYSYLAYPKLFVNDRTRQLMANPHVKKLMLRDLYISPINYNPGQPPGVSQRLVLAKGESGQAGDLDIRFLDFNLERTGNPVTQFSSGGAVTLGVDLAITRNGQSEQMTAFYSFEQSGRVVTPPAALPGGGQITMSGVNPNEGRVQLDLVGLDIEPSLAQLSIDLTRKPLIKMVWYGLYVVLLGGAIATVDRYRASQRVDHLAATSHPSS